MEKAFSEKLVKDKVRALLEANPKQKWLQEGFTIIANRAVVDENLTSSDLRVYVILLMHLINREVCFPSQKTIAQEAGIKTTRQILNIMRKLEKLGYVKVERTAGKVNIYRPLIK